MTSGNGERGTSRAHPISALPSARARLLAFVAIIGAGLCGGLIGTSAVTVGCRGSCGTPEGVGGLIGAVTAASGVAVIAVLVLRAMGEWRSIREKREMEAIIAAASSAVAEFQGPQDLSELAEVAFPEDLPPTEEPKPPKEPKPPGSS